MPRTVRVSHPILNPEALAEQIALAYQLPTPISSMFVSPGVNDTYQVIAGAHSFFYRVYRAGLRSRSDIEFELELLRHLQREGIPVSVPIPKTDGSYITGLPAPEACGLRSCSPLHLVKS